MIKQVAIIFISFLSTLLTTDANTLILVAGNSVHRWGDHENLQICKLYKELLKESLPDLNVEIVDSSKAQALDLERPINAIIVVAEGENNHPFKDNPAILKDAYNKKINVGVVHYVLHFNEPKDYDYLDMTVGGHYEPYWSTNPTWRANFKLSKHEISRGVNPFSIEDEYYFNIRFNNRKDQKLIPIATAVPPDSTRMRKFGAHTGNPYIRVNKGKSEILLWAVKNPNGTRGFGYAGGHSIWAWANKDFRKLMLNAAAWISNIDIPEGGLESANINFDKIASQIAKPHRGDQYEYEKKWRDFVKENSAK